MDHQPLVSLITVNYNGRAFLHGLLESLQACRYPHLEIILVDNASADDSVAFVRSHYPQVQIVENAQNYRFARGNNIGMARARGSIVGLINNDVVVDPDFLQPIVAAFAADAELGAVQPKVLDLQRPGYLEYAGACGGFLDRLGYPFLRGRLFDRVEPDLGQYDTPLQVFWGSGAALFLRKQALEQVGGLDEAFELHMEEIDLCWRLHLAGWRIAVLPESRIWHYGGGTLAQHHPQKFYWNFRNNLFLLIKNLSANRLWRVLPLRIVLDGLALLNELVRGKWRHAGFIARAYLWLLAHLPLLMARRAANRPWIARGAARTEALLYPGSIVWEYFLRGRRRFADLKYSQAFTRRLAYGRHLSPTQMEGVEQPYGTETV
ncbi:MAG: glycosyltransferase family 2 protein [Calditrichaeota bacterium]|nr:MAG: glycosyltransferase family 2 protein [Calditrichota bacterium]